jgi:hypothetical protein
VKSGEAFRRRQPQTHLGLYSPRWRRRCCSVSDGLGALEVYGGLWSLARRGRGSILSLGCFPYPRFDVGSSADGGRVVSCAWQICYDLVGFYVRWCDFMPVSSDLLLSLLAMIVALVRWSFRMLARRLLNCLLQQTLLR